MLLAFLKTVYSTAQDLDDERQSKTSVLLDQLAAKRVNTVKVVVHD